MAHHQRSDVCAVPAAGVVAEAMVALVLAEATLEKFGGDSVAETRRNHLAYLKQIADRGCRSAPARAAPAGDAPSRSFWSARPGSGKSHRRGRPSPSGSACAFRDVDAVIEERVGKPVAEIFADDGEPAFRAARGAGTAELLDRARRAGARRRRRALARTRAALRGRRVVWLRVGLAAAVKRVGLDTARPLLLGNVRGRLLALLNERAPLYAEVASEVGRHRRPEPGRGGSADRGRSRA